MNSIWKNKDEIIDQSLIDVEIDDDFTDSSESDDTQFKTIENCTDNFSDNLSEEALLNTINGIGIKIESHFDNISDIVQKKNMIKIISFFFRSILRFYHKICLPNNSYDNLIKLLSTVDPIFDLKLFNFKNPKYLVSSAISFYRLFLNRFFLKQSREKLFERCSTILFSLTKPGDFFYKEIHKNKKNFFNDRNILFQWETYLALVYFIHNRKIHFKFKNIKFCENYFTKEKIPQIINKNYLKSCNFHEQDALFYQLQFIFDALDNKKFVYRFHECILKTIRKLKQAKVPDFKTLTSNIRAKNISLIIQIKKYSKISNNNNNNNNNKEDNKEEENNQKPIIQNINDLNILKKISPPNPNSFDQRQLEKTKKVNEIKKQKNKNHSSINLESPESFWNPIDNYFAIDNGVLFKKAEQNQFQQQQLIDDISNYENKIKRITIDESNLFSTVPIRDNKTHLFKFFYYNEQSHKWEMDSTLISNFIIQNKHLNSLNTKVPLIFFSNSYENDLITLNSKLLLSLYPDLDDNDIYVYALCDKSLSLLEYNINIQEETMNIKPIFLLLHVPKSKQHIENIKMIVFKIYYFLSIVCDVEIVILNKEHYADQINLIKSMQNIKRSYKEASQKRIERKELIIKRNSSQEMKLDKGSFSLSSSYVDFSDDDDDYGYSDDDIDNNKSFANFDVNSMNGALELINLNLFVKKSKHIILINDESIDGDITEVNNNKFFKSIQEQIKAETCSINYINVNKAVTYRLFLKSLKEFVIDVKNESEDVIKNFDIFPITEINSKYINLKSKNEWENELKNIIYDRFKQYKDANLDESNDFILISKLNSEITKMNPSIDYIFLQKCNTFLDKIRNDLAQLNNDVFISELSISSNNNLNYLKQIINSHPYWQDEKKDFIYKSHENFLNNEFFSIIKAFYPKKDYSLIIDLNLSILENQVKKDRKAILKLFREVENKLKPPQDQAVDLFDEMKKGTNYSIRETERVREIKVIAKAGHLKEVIPQDF
ncbi:hypothetical protein M9Y10_024413 [Tritrichomonas musculus]|uniref:Uncharacterized protein n=1 Tax=Tritrichomonas musculus TaxID=1915356 RepID=A0ABR2HBY8_9EUKA